jgi:magnesium chelatase subunit D
VLKLGVTVYRVSDEVANRLQFFSFLQVQSFSFAPGRSTLPRGMAAFRMSAVADESTAANDAAERARLVMEAEDAMSGKEAVGIKETKMMSLGGRPFPLSMIKGQENIKQALLLASVNNRMGGVVISGGKGTAKSVMARALHQLLPPIEVIKDSPFNIDPEGAFGIDDFTRTDLDNGGIPLEERETEVIDCPFVQVPLNVMEDRLIGSADLEESVKTGKTVFAPGLLAKAHRGVLYVDDINLLDEETANILLGVVNEGVVTVEREGLSLKYPCKPLLIATFNPDEGELRDHLLDRIAIALSADAQKLDVLGRVEAVESVLNFSASGPQKGEKATAELENALEMENDIKTAIIFAREYIKELGIAPTQVQYLCEEAIRAGCQGHRAEIFACEVARASAALEGRQVNSEDLKLAVKLAIAPRGTFINTPMDENDMMPPPPPPPPPPPQMDEQNQEDQDQEDEEDEEDQQEPEEEDDEKEESADVPEVPQEFMFDADATPMDPDLIEFASRERGGKGGGRGLIFSQDRGRYIKPMLPKGKVVRLAGKNWYSSVVERNAVFNDFPLLQSMPLSELLRRTRRLDANELLEPNTKAVVFILNSLMFAPRKWHERLDPLSSLLSMLLDPWLLTE